MSLLSFLKFWGGLGNLGAWGILGSKRFKEGQIGERLRLFGLGALKTIGQAWEGKFYFPNFF